MQNTITRLGSECFRVLSHTRTVYTCMFIVSCVLPRDETASDYRLCGTSKFQRSAANGILNKKTCALTRGQSCTTELVILAATANVLELYSHSVKNFHLICAFWQYSGQTFRNCFLNFLRGVCYSIVWRRKLIERLHVTGAGIAQSV
jgi:hypothetical protein